jgi:dihydroorotate dehydrogenase electron transfer subunit
MIGGKSSMRLNSTASNSTPVPSQQPDLDADDGTIEGLVLESPSQIGEAALLPIGLSSALRQTHAAARYFLARCGAQTLQERSENWQIYLRRPLFASRLQPQFMLNEESTTAEAQEEERFDQWDLLIPPNDDPGHSWLRRLVPGSTVNLIGPLGRGFALSTQTRNLLVLTEPDRLAVLLPVIDRMLDQNGRVTLILHDAQRSNPTPLLAMLPLAVEVHLADSFERWRQHVDESVAWADQICAALPPSTYLSLAETIRQRRFRLEPDFVQMLAEADLACGTGACLACVVPSANGGVTRACVHGPVMDLTRLVGR